MKDRVGNQATWGCDRFFDSTPRHSSSLYWMTIRAVGRRRASNFLDFAFENQADFQPARPSKEKFPIRNRNPESNASWNDRNQTVQPRPKRCSRTMTETAMRGCGRRQSGGARGPTNADSQASQGFTQVVNSHSRAFQDSLAMIRSERRRPRCRRRGTTC